MKHYAHFLYFSVLTLVIALAVSPAGAVSIVVPGGLANTEGGSNNAFPFNDSIVSIGRYQQVYAASEFPSGSMVLSSMAFRPDGYSGGAFASVFSDVEISFSTTLRTPANLSTTFADNIGSDRTVVRSGSLSLSSSGTGAGPRDFDIVVPFTTPFTYDPSFGNLLMEIKKFGTSPYTTQFDSAGSSNLVMNRVWASSATSTTGLSIGDKGLVTQFSSTAPPIPEPLTVLAVCAGLAGITRYTRKRVLAS